MARITAVPEAEAGVLGRLVDRLARIDDYATDPLHSPAERLAVAYADAMTATPPAVTDAQVAELEREFGRAGLLELTQAIAVENQRARGNHALGIVDQGSTRPAGCGSAGWLRPRGSSSRGRRR